VVYGAVVVFMIISRPEGLMGGKEISFKGIYNLLLKLTGKNKHDRQQISGGE
jgi:branched-chain amino acid transport system permease protein